MLYLINPSDSHTTVVSTVVILSISLNCAFAGGNLPPPKEISIQETLPTPPDSKPEVQEPAYQLYKDPNIFTEPTGLLPVLDERMGYNFGILLRQDSPELLTRFILSQSAFNSYLEKRARGMAKRSAIETGRALILRPLVDQIRYSTWVQDSFSAKEEEGLIQTPLTSEGLYYDQPHPRKTRAFRFHTRLLREDPFIALDIFSHTQVRTFIDKVELNTFLPLNGFPTGWALAIGAQAKYRDLQSWRVGIGIAGPFSIRQTRGISYVTIGMHDNGVGAMIVASIPW